MDSEQTFNGISVPVTTGYCHTGMWVGNPVLQSVSVTDYRVEIVYRRTPNFTYTVMGSGATPPDEVWKEIWVAESPGILRRLPDVRGTHTHAYNVPEKIEFPE